MLVNRYFVDREIYDVNDNRIYGDMGFTFGEMPNIFYKTIEDAKQDIEYGINYEMDNADEFDGEISVYIIVEYTFDSDKVNGDDFNLYNYDAIVGYRKVCAMCQTISDYNLYKEMNDCFSKYYDFDVEMV